jgi:Cu/Ag efflux pump CusA
MRWFIASILRLAAPVAAAAALLLGVGIASLGHAPVAALPEFLPPQVQVQTEALGLSTQEVEQLVTVPLEDEFNGLAFLDHLRSQSVPGLSSIELTFKPGTDIYKARQLVTERVAQGPAVVNVGTPPVMIQPLSAESRAMEIGLSSGAVSPIELSTLARWRIRPRLLAVPGVANVTIWGERDQQLQVLVDPARLHAKGVTLTQVINTTGDAMWTSPLSFVEASSPGADGFIDTPNQRLSIQHQLPISTAQDLSKVPLEETGTRTVPLGSVTTVVTDHPAMRGDALLRSGPGFLLVVEKFPGANTLAVDRGVEQAMADLRPGLAGVTVDTHVFRPADYVETALHDIGWAALAGLVLLTLWLGLLWRSWRVALLALVATVLPLVAAGYVLYLAGATFTALTAAGLLTALGYVVDDAVTTLAALPRRGGHARGGQRPSPSPAEGAQGSRPTEPPVTTGALTDALLRGRRPLGYALAVTLLTLVPLFLLTGLDGSLTRPVAVAYLAAVVAAAVVAVTATPALALLLLRRGPLPRPAFAGRGGRLRLPRRRAVVWAAVGALAACAVVVSTEFGARTLVPAFQDRSLLVRWQAAPGTSLPAMERTTAAAAAELRALPGVRDVASDIGQALMGDRISDVDAGSTWISLAPGADYGSARSSVSRVLAHYPGLRHTLLTYPQAAIAAAPADTTSAGPALTVRLYGTDPGVLAAQAQRVRATLAGIPGVRAPAVTTVPVRPTIEIATNVSAAARYGLKPGDVRRATAVLVGGIPVGSYYQQQQIFDVTVWSVPTARDSLTDVQNLLLDTPTGGQVPLRSVADVAIRPAATEIDHDQASRYVDITADVHGPGLGTEVPRVRAALQALELPLGYHTEVTSALEQRQNDDLRLLVSALACLLCVVLLCQAALRSWRSAALLVLTLPLALSGGAITAFLAGPDLTAGALLGFLAVLGVAVRTGLRLLHRIRALEPAEPDTPLQELVARAAQEAVRPVLATTVGAALVLLPFAVRGDVAGLEYLRPLALVALGGLATTAFTVLVLLPALYLRLPRPFPRRRADEAVH